MKINIYNFFEQHWLILPLASAFLLTLTFYPFDFWFLGFFALVPLLYFVTFSKNISIYKIFGAGFSVGFLVTVTLSFFTLIQFHWLPEAYLFSWMVRLSFILIAIVSGFFAGLAVISYRYLRLNSPLDIFTGAAIWIVTEWLINIIFKGYHLGLLAYALHKTPLVGLAAIGGVHFVSFLVILANAFIVSILLWSRYRILYPEIYQQRISQTLSKNPFVIFFYSTKRIIFVFLITFSIIGVIYWLNNIYLSNGEENSESKSFALIQLQERKTGAFGEFQNNRFYFQKLENLINSANNLKPDFIIYPFSPFIGVLSAEENPEINLKNFSDWVQKTVNDDAVFITWNNVFRDKQFYNEFNFWQGDKQIAYYQKRILFPFMDYTPNFSKKIGLYTTPFDAKAGPINQKIELNGFKIGNLICSEIYKPIISKMDSRWANILLALGSEAIFVDDIAGNFNIIVSQFRAAENNLPIIRGSRFGPSAIINSQGKILAKLDFGKEGVLFKKIEYQLNPQRTLYGYIGDWGFMGGIWMFLIIVLIIKITKNHW